MSLSVVARRTYNLLLFVVVAELEGVIEEEVRLPLVVVGVHDLKVLLRKASGRVILSNREALIGTQLGTVKSA